MRKTPREGNYKLILLLSLGMLCTGLYFCVRTILFITADYPWTDKMFGSFLLAAEMFILIHGVGYFMNIFHVARASSEMKEIEIPPPSSYPVVVIVVASYKEPLEIVRDTLLCFYNLTYPNKRLVFLDDTRYDTPWDTPEAIQRYKASIEQMCADYEVNLFRRKWHDAKAGLINDFLQFLNGEPNEEFHFYHFDKKSLDQSKYLIIFDSDMNPFPNFVEPLVSLMEQNDRMAFVQTPQYYTNFETNRIARASGLMQVVFFEFICEAKGMENSMICCGTNVIFRLEALYDVGGFDTSSVTEDFATSFLLHKKKWSSSYLNKISAFGIGPEDFGAYFKQQYRWAYGTVSLYRKLLVEFVKNPFALPPLQWWQYFLSSTYYFIGWVYFIMMVNPLMYIFFNIPAYFSNPALYFTFFLPYIVLSNFLFYWTLSFKGYKFKDVFSGIVLINLTFPVYMKAVFFSMLGKKQAFVVTPKAGCQEYPLRDLWPQVLMSLISLSALTWGALRLYYESELFGSISINMVWCLYYFLLLSSILYFNKPVEEKMTYSLDFEAS